MSTGIHGGDHANIGNDKSIINPSGLRPNPKGRLFEQVREGMRFHHYALPTEKAYLPLDSTVTDVPSERRPCGAAAWLE